MGKTHNKFWNTNYEIKWKGKQKRERWDFPAWWVDPSFTAHFSLPPPPPFIHAAGQIPERQPNFATFTTRRVPSCSLSKPCGRGAALTLTAWGTSVGPSPSSSRGRLSSLDLFSTLGANKNDGRLWEIRPCTPTNPWASSPGGFISRSFPGLLAQRRPSRLPMVCSLRRAPTPSPHHLQQTSWG
jgi:hypothetical protein